MEAVVESEVGAIVADVVDVVVEKFLCNFPKRTI